MAIENNATIISIVVEKIEGESSWGFGLAQLQNSPNLIVKNVKDNSPASRGGLRNGDVILSIENESMIGKSVQAAGDIIKRSQGGKLAVSFSRAGAADDANKENNMLSSIPPQAVYQGMTESILPAEQVESPDDYQRVTLPRIDTTNQPTAPSTAEQPDPILIHHLKKWSSYPGFGFSIQQKSNGSKIVVKIEPNTPAFASGIKQNAVLCQVNATNVRASSYQDTVKLIKESGAQVSITVTSFETLQWLDNAGKRLEESLSELKVHTLDPPPEPPTSEPPVDLAATSVSLPLQETVTSIYAQPVHETVNTTPMEVVAPAATVTDAPTTTSVYNSEASPMSIPVTESPPIATTSATIAQQPPVNETPLVIVYRCSLTKNQEKGYGFGLKQEAPRNEIPGCLTFSKVDANSPAFEAGLEVGMVALAINNTFVINSTMLQAKPLVAARADGVEFLVCSRETFATAIRAYGADIEAAANNFQIENQQRKFIQTAPVTTMPEEIQAVWPHDFPLPRNCLLSKWPEKFRGYGFHLQAERNRQGHFIGKLDPGSPAEFGGLVVNWRIVAVNDQNVLNEPHASVVQRIQASGDTVCMLIAAPEVVNFCEQHHIVMSKTMTECAVQSFQTPLSPPDDLAATSRTPMDVSSPVSQAGESTPVSHTKEVSQSPAPPTPPSPLPLSPQVNQNRNQESQQDADLAYLKTIRDTMGTRRLRDARRQPNRDIKMAFEQANSL